jgi:hypothetical protein
MKEERCCLCDEPLIMTTKAVMCDPFWYIELNKGTKFICKHCFKRLKMWICEENGDYFGVKK